MNKDSSLISGDSNSTTINNNSFIITINKNYDSRNITKGINKTIEPVSKKAKLSGIRSVSRSKLELSASIEIPEDIRKLRLD